MATGTIKLRIAALMASLFGSPLAALPGLRDINARPSNGLPGNDGSLAGDGLG